MESFVRLFDNNRLQLNIGKTKGLVVENGLIGKVRPPAPVTMQGEEGEEVDPYKFLGVHWNNNVDWTYNIEVLYRRGQSKRFFPEEA